eukprot:2390729-Prymnesium_polylepis.1
MGVNTVGVDTAGEVLTQPHTGVDAVFTRAKPNTPAPLSRSRQHQQPQQHDAARAQTKSNACRLQSNPTACPTGVSKRSSLASWPLILQPHQHGQGEREGTTTQVTAHGIPNEVWRPVATGAYRVT